MKKAPSRRGQNRTKSFSLADRHAAGLAFVRVDRNQKSVPVGVGEFMSLHIGAVIERAIHFEAVIVLRSEILDVLQYDAFAVGAALGLQLHRRHLTTSKTGVDDIPCVIDLDWSFLHFQFAPFQTLRL